MELVIIHENGWACTNESSQGHALDEGDDGQWYRTFTVSANNVYNVIGNVSNGSEAFFIFDNGDGWVCDIILVKNKLVKAQRKSVLTKDKVNILINQIKSTK